MAVKYLDTTGLGKLITWIKTQLVGKLSTSGGTVTGSISVKSQTVNNIVTNGFNVQSVNDQHHIYFGIGSSDNNRGIYDAELNDWVVLVTNHSNNSIERRFNGSAVLLRNSRAFITNLASESAVYFDGTSNCSHGVTGTLSISHGGTGATTASAALTNLGAYSKTEVDNKLSGKVATTITINGKALSSGITLSASDVGAYSKTEVDNKLEGISSVPACTDSDNGKVLMVVDGVPTWSSIPSANGVSF